MDKRFLAILGVLVLIFVGIIAFSGKNNNGSGKTNPNAQPTKNVEGQGQKGVKLVEYGDFECPVCSAYYQPVKQVQAQFDKEIYFQFRNLPLTTIHKNAFAAARAAEAAAKQNKFWQMHDMIYENQDPTGAGGWVVSNNALDDYFSGYAKQLGLDVAKFKTDYASSAVNDAINADIAAFNKTGQQMATPTFFLDGKYVPNSDLSDPQTGRPTAEMFAKIINKEIAAKNKTQ